jgi:hypothetical protein
VTIPPLEKIDDPKIWRVVNRRAELHEENGRKFVHFGKGIGEGAYWLVGSDFNEGEIEADLRGKNIRGESFVGFSFHGPEDHKCDTVYFRPFNFQDPERRNHSVQYISMPGFPWEKLREETPGKYEAAIDPAPGPDDWFHARIVFESRTVSVFVNGSLKQALVVKEMSDRKGGMIGLGGTNADYASLKVTTKK